LTLPTTSGENPAPRIKNVVDSAPAKASPSLYSTISARILMAPLREKNSWNGTVNASYKVRGATLAPAASGSGASQVSTAAPNISSPMKIYMPLQPIQTAASQMANPPDTTMPMR